MVPYEPYVIEPFKALLSLHRSASLACTEYTIGIRIRRGVDLSAADRDGWTPLYCASYYLHPEVCQLLVILGVPVRSNLRYAFTSCPSEYQHYYTSIYAT